MPAMVLLSKITMLMLIVWTLPLVLISHSSFNPVAAEDFFCSEDGTNVEIQGEITGRIITLYPGEATYRNNMHCSWTLETDPTSRIQMKVELSRLQWSPAGSFCDGYDHVDVKDESDNSLLASWCGEESPRVINSKGNKVEITFKTDASNPPSYSFQGVRLTFQTFSKTSCPPDWEMFRDFCYSKGHARMNWASSQSVCNYGQANLLSLSSREEFTFITQAFLTTSQEDFFWTGLNDISDPGTLQWIDSTSLHGFRGATLPQPAKFFHCGAFRTGDKRLMMRDCKRSKYQFLCKAHRTNVTALYAVPRAPTNKGDSGENSTARNLALGIAIPAAVVLLAITAGCVWHMKCRGKPRHYESTAQVQRTNSQELSSVAVHENSRMESYSHVVPSAPPSYEEALSNSPIN